jgi:hypothetical protein
MRKNDVFIMFLICAGGTALVARSADLNWFGAFVATLSFGCGLAIIFDKNTTQTPTGHLNCVKTRQGKARSSKKSTVSQNKFGDSLTE